MRGCGKAEGQCRLATAKIDGSAATQQARAMNQNQSFFQRGKSSIFKNFDQTERLDDKTSGLKAGNWSGQSLAAGAPPGGMTSAIVVFSVLTFIPGASSTST